MLQTHAVPETNTCTGIIEARANLFLHHVYNLTDMYKAAISPTLQRLLRGLSQ